MLWKKAPFLLKLVLLLAIVPLLALNVGQPVSAALQLDSPTDTPVFEGAAIEEEEIISLDRSRARLVIKPLPSGRVVLPGTQLPNQPESPEITGSPVEDSPIELPQIAPLESVSPENEHPEPQPPQAEFPPSTPSESDTPVEVPGFSPAIQPASEPDRSIPAIVWVVFPSVVLGVLLFLWRGKRRSTGRSKLVSQPPASQKTPASQTSAEPKNSSERKSLEGELEEAEVSVLTAHPLEPSVGETERPSALSDTGSQKDLSTAQLEKSFKEQVDETITETLEVAPEPKLEVAPEAEPNTGLKIPEGSLEISSGVLPDGAVDGVSLVDRSVAEESIAKGSVLEESIAEEPVLEESVADEPPHSNQANISAPALSESSPPRPQHLAANWTVARLQEAFLADLLHFQGKTLETATLQECYAALVRLICAEILGSADFSTPETRLAQPEGRIVAELFPCCANPLPIATTINNLGLLPIVEPVLQQLGLSLSQLSTQQKETALNQSSLGNLLVGYLEALATAEVAAIGYGMHDVKAVEPLIRKGWQVENSIDGTRQHDPWYQPRPDLQVEVKFGGQTYAYLDEHQHYRVQWIPSEGIVGIPYDVPIVGYQNNTVNRLRLWHPTFAGEEASVAKLALGLLPQNLPEAMPEPEQIVCSLKQQYFLVACTVQDLLRLHFKTGGTPETVAQRIAVQLNEPGTVLAIAELMRLLLDDYGMAWEQAWEMTQQTFSYTQHSVLLASVNQLYSLELFANLLPRHLEVIYEVNSRFLTEVRDRYPGEIYRLRQMSLIDEQGDRYVRLPYLACLGSYTINGVSQLQMDLLQQKILRDFHQEYPDKFKTIRNGITPRLGLLYINPSLSDLISAKIGDIWITDLGELSKLSAYVEDSEFVQYWRQVKQAAKSSLADRIYQQYGMTIDANSLFDVQAIEFNPAQRQALNLLHIITLYQRLKAHPTLSFVPRTFLVTGTAAPHDDESKLLIKLMHSVAEVINADPATAKMLKLVYLNGDMPSWVQALSTAADVTEFLAVPQLETSDVSPLVALMNGSFIIGAANGLNLELADVVGASNLFLLGTKAQARLALSHKDYQPRYFYQTNTSLRSAIDQLASGYFTQGEVEWVTPLINSWLNHDPCILLADYQPYLECQDRVSQAYRDPVRWTQMSILNTIKIGNFSADYAVQEYCLKIWNIQPVTQRLREHSKLFVG